MTLKPPSVDELKRSRRLGRQMKQLYGELDKEWEKATDGVKISCKVGCASCCYLLTLATLPEGIAIAEHFLSDVQRRNMIPDLMRKFWEQLQHIEAKGVRTIRDGYFRKKVPCTFLDTVTNRCTIYSVRPEACRYHAVVTDPELCSPDVRGVVGKVNAMQFDAATLSEANRISNQAKLPLFIAPLPVVMLWSFKLLIEGREAFDLALHDPEMGVMDLMGWMERLNEDEGTNIPSAFQALPPEALVSAAEVPTATSGEPQAD